MKEPKIQRKIRDLRNCLYRIHEGSLAKISSQTNIAQQMSIDEGTAEAFTKNLKGNVFIVQAAQVNTQVISDSSKALQFLDGIADALQSGQDMLDMAIAKLIYNEGRTAAEIEQLVQKSTSDLAITNTKSVTAAARLIGLKRTTFVERRRKLKLVENTPTEDIIEVGD